MFGQHIGEWARDRRQRIELCVGERCAVLSQVVNHRRERCTECRNVKRVESEQANRCGGGAAHEMVQRAQRNLDVGKACRHPCGAERDRLQWTVGT